jgi:transglutaminase-like putative cysteine protease
MPSGMRCRVIHLTTYEYDGPVEHAYNEAHLRPRSENGQQCLSHHLEVTPEPVACSETVDPFGNRVAIFSVRGGFRELSVKATSEVVTATARPAPSGPPWESVRMMLDVDRTPSGRDARRYRAPSRLVLADEAFAHYARISFRPSRPLIEATSELASRIHHEFVYEPGATSVSTPLKEFYESRRGVCQDFAHLMIACARSMGLAARYVSGYIQTEPPGGHGPLVGSVASHAWASVYLPEWGWVDLDPTNDQMVGSSYVTTAWGRDYWDVSPLRGSVEGGGDSHQLHVSVRVEPIAEAGALQA